MDPMPRLVQTPSPNYTPIEISHDLIIIHMMEGGCAGSVAFLCLTTTKASAHLCMSEDGSTVYQLVPLSMEAWAQCAGNRKGISLEIPGFTAQGIPEARWRAAARIVAWLCLTYGIPPVWAAGGVGRGIAQHHDGGAAWGGHVDCSPVGSPTFMTFLGYVKEAVDAFGSGPLPPWALHGLPAPHAVDLPPNVPAEPTHGGADRSTPGSIGVVHNTASTYPHGSCADMQYRLTELGYGLKIDGLAGPATRAALKAFQQAHGLDDDGLIGPQTWAALNAATA